MRRVEELLDPGVEQQERVEPHDRLDADGEGDESHDDGLDQAGQDHDPLAVVAVHVHAGEQSDDEARDGRGHERQPDREGGSRLLVDPDPGREVGQGRSGGRDQLRRPKEREVTPPEHGEHRRRGRGRRSGRRGRGRGGHVRGSLAPGARPRWLDHDGLITARAGRPRRPGARFRRHPAPVPKRRGTARSERPTRRPSPSGASGHPGARPPAARPDPGRCQPPEHSSSDPRQMLLEPHIWHGPRTSAHTDRVTRTRRS